VEIAISQAFYRIASMTSLNWSATTSLSETHEEIA
jgi:hypothetical protein